MAESCCLQRNANRRTAPFVLDRARQAKLTNHQRLENVEQPIFVPKFETTTTNNIVEPGMQGSYVLLPFRALEEICLPAAIQQRWEASVAASKCAEWRLWFQTLDQTQQKAHVQSLSKSTNDNFWLEYEERSKPRKTRYIATAARAQVILEQEIVRRQMEEAQRAWYAGCAQPHLQPKELPRHGLVLSEDFAEPLSGPLSAPLTALNIISLRLRLAPSYFRLPDSAFRFATQIFSGKSYEEAVAEQKANFNSWARESRVKRMDGHPDFVLWGGDIVVRTDDMNLIPEKKQPQKKRKASKSLVEKDS